MAAVDLQTAVEENPFGPSPVFLGGEITPNVYYPEKYYFPKRDFMEGDPVDFHHYMTNATSITLTSATIELTLSPYYDFDRDDDIVAGVQFIPYLTSMATTQLRWRFPVYYNGLGLKYQLMPIIWVTPSEGEAYAYFLPFTLNVLKWYPADLRAIPPLGATSSTLTIVNAQNRRTYGLMTPTPEDLPSTGTVFAVGSVPPPGEAVEGKVKRKPEFMADELIVRFRTEEAVRLHTHYLTSGAAFSEARMAMTSVSACGISDLPKDCVAITPSRAGSYLVRHVLAEKQPGVSASLEKGSVLTASEVRAITETIEVKARPNCSIGLFVVKIRSGASLSETRKALSSRPDVVYACLSPIARIAGKPNDTLYPDQWNMESIRARQAWDFVPPRLGNVRVCVVDTGVRVTHKDFAGRVIHPLDIYVNFEDPRPYGRNAYWNNDPNDDDLTGHGTAAAGIIGAVRDNFFQIAGIAPVQIIPVNADMGPEIGLYNYWEGIHHGIDMGAHIINLSLSRSGSPTDAEEEAIERAQEEGVIIVAAAGNDGEDTGGYTPASIPYCITVSAVDAEHNRVRMGPWWWASNFGDEVSVCAPGEGSSKDPLLQNFWREPGSSYVHRAIFSTGHRYDTGYTPAFYGTSAAAAHVSGVCALIKQVAPWLPPDLVRLAIEISATDRVGLPIEDTPGWDPYYGHGLLNAEAAVMLAQGMPYIALRNFGSLPLQITSLTLLNEIPPPPPDDEGGDGGDGNGDGNGGDDGGSEEGSIGITVPQEAFPINPMPSWISFHPNKMPFTIDPYGVEILRVWIQYLKNPPYSEGYLVLMIHSTFAFRSPAMVRLDILFPASANETPWYLLE